MLGEGGLIMRIFFISEINIVILSTVLWFVFQVSAALISLKIPSKWVSPSSFIFKERKWEKGGEFYSKIFKVRKWKKFLPDGSAISKKGYRKKTLTNYSKENLERFLEESCRAELTHSLAILPFWVFGLFAQVEIIGIMLVYALIVNMPCIIVQRFNRPRILKILEKKNKLKENK